MTREEITPNMSHKEMIDTLKGLVFGTFDRTTAKEREALDMAIKALEQESCEDAISRQAAIDALQEVSKYYTEKGRKWHPHVDFMVDAIKDLPSVTPTQEPILDKIRAEIEKLRPNLRPEQMTDYDYAMVDVVNDIVAIIDKYKE